MDWTRARTLQPGSRRPSCTRTLKRMSPEQRAATIATVAATMRQVANWGLAFDNGPACDDNGPACDELRSIADQVELLSSGDDMCCPMCEETACDEDCPLAAVRAHAE